MARPDSPAAGPPAPFPVLRTALTESALLDRLDKASRRGKLPGFHRGAPGAASPFWLEVFGKYFDRRLLVRVESEGSASEPSLVLRFESRVKQFRIIAFWVVVALSVWPGVALTDSILATYFSWYPREFWVTCAWYLPLTILPIPWMWRTAWRQSASIADAEARASIAKIMGHLDASPVEPG